MNPDAPQPGREPPPPSSFKLPSIRLLDLKSQLPPKDWPHAPVHRLADNAVYFVTAGTLQKKHLFDTPQKRDLLEHLLFSFAKESGWQLEAWAVFANTITSWRAAILIRGILATLSMICTASPRAS